MFRQVFTASSGAARTLGFSLRCVQAFTDYSGSLPSAGFRRFDLGVLSNFGSEGYYWYSIPSGSGSATLGYIGSSVCFSASHRSGGFSLRCVQAFTGYSGSLPSAGYRYRETGGLASVGSMALYVTGVPSGSQCMVIDCESPYVCLYAAARTNARLLRCVQVFTGSFRKDFFPSAGFRTRDTGALSAVGSNGYAWSAGYEDASGFRIVFDGTFLASSGSTRAHGFVLRCVRAFTFFRNEKRQEIGYLSRKWRLFGRAASK